MSILKNPEAEPRGNREEHKDNRDADDTEAEDYGADHALAVGLVFLGIVEAGHAVAYAHGDYHEAGGADDFDQLHGAVVARRYVAGINRNHQEADGTGNRLTNDIDQRMLAGRQDFFA